MNLEHILCKVSPLWLPALSSLCLNLFNYQDRENSLCVKLQLQIVYLWEVVRMGNYTTDTSPNCCEMYVLTNFTSVLRQSGGQSPYWLQLAFRCYISNYLETCTDKQNASSVVILFVLVTTLIKSHKPHLECLIILEYNHLWHPHVNSLRKVKTNNNKLDTFVRWSAALWASLQGNQLHLDIP